MKTSEQINELASALSKAQGRLKNIVPKNDVDMTLKSGRRVKYSYADLGAVIDSIKKELAAEGLSYAQDVIASELCDSVCTRLMHSSGQWIEASCPILRPQDMGINPMQTFGGLITYARRYSLAAVLGIATDFDSDAEIDEPKIKKEPTPLPKVYTKKEEPKIDKKVTAEELKKIMPAAAKMGMDKTALTELIKQRYDVASGSQLTKEQYADLCVYVGI